MANRNDFEKTGNFRPRLVQFIRGIRGERANPVDLKQILSQFHATPAAFVCRELDALIDEGLVRISPASLGRQKHNARYTHELTDAGFERFEYYVRNHACHTG